MKLEISAAYVDLVTDAHAYATARQDELRRDFRLHEYARWNWDQETGQLEFYAAEGGAPCVICDILFAGSVSTITNTWLWSWANPHFERRLTEDVADARLLGEARDIPQLTEPKWEADAVDGWEMTSITAFVLQAKGVYRTPTETGFT